MFLYSLNLEELRDRCNMRPTIRLMMASAMSASNGLKAQPMALLPPIPLYRRLLRAHRKHLPQEMRLLGDEYIKAEFRAHRDVDNPVHIVRLPSQPVISGVLTDMQIGFLTEWQMYAQKIEGDSWVGEKLDPGKIEKLSGSYSSYTVFRPRSLK